jgi:hypothetical protein
MPYGKIFLESLPRYRTTQDLTEVERFLSATPEVESTTKDSKRAARAWD